MTQKTAVARFAIIVCAVLFTTVVSAQQITLKPGAIPNKEFHRANARDFAYCEIAPGCDFAIGEVASIGSVK